ncbi:MAG: bifunctional response regulator/alkaline phosphatase family protein [Bacteroidota bacterium]
MRKINVLWTDDEIALLKPHILFLQEKGYHVITANNGDDAIALVKTNYFDIIFLDENMPGKSGLQTLVEIKRLFPSIPIIMVTKSEEEDIMDQAIGSKISDYLIKPVNPKQILLTIKKYIDNKRLVTEKTTSNYQVEFGKLGMEINSCATISDWIEVYKKIVYWELELEKSNDNTMDEVLNMQKNEANSAFAKFIGKNYFSFFQDSTINKPLLSPNLFKTKVFPHLANNGKVFVILVDNLRYDQWKILQPTIREYFHLEDEDMFCSILPTATQYARNSMFSGLMPSEIDKIYPDFWLNDEEEGGKNLHEEEMLKSHLQRYVRNSSFIYEKVFTFKHGQKLVENFKNIIKHPFGVIVYNFVDILSHARTEMKMIQELANDESAYRSLTLSWFQHSSMLSFMKLLAENDIKMVLTTDHGTIRVNNPIKVVGDKNTTTNLRYKQGKNLNYNPKEVFEIKEPEKAFLPKTNVSSKYIFARSGDFFAYPNNYNHYIQYYKNTFQHGGISLEEMLIPVITLTPK